MAVFIECCFENKLPLRGVTPHFIKPGPVVSWVHLSICGELRSKREWELSVPESQSVLSRGRGVSKARNWTKLEEYWVWDISRDFLRSDFRTFWAWDRNLMLKSATFWFTPATAVFEQCIVWCLQFIETAVQLFAGNVAGSPDLGTNQMGQIRDIFRSDCSRPTFDCLCRDVSFGVILIRFVPISDNLFLRKIAAEIFGSFF